VTVLQDRHSAGARGKRSTMTARLRDFASPRDGMIAREPGVDDTLGDTARSAPRLRISERMVVTSFAVLVALVAVLSVTPWPVGAFHDDAMYTVLARSLTEGHGYRFLNLLGEPNVTHVPPGYPLVLALLWMVAPLRQLTDAEDLGYAQEISRDYRPDYYIVNSRPGARTGDAPASEPSPILRYFGNIATVRIYTRIQP